MNIEVNMGDVMISRRSGDNLISSGVGSCLVIIFYDHNLKIGTLAHAMLPSSTVLKQIGDYNSNKEDILEAKYVDTAIEKMLQKMRRLGSRKDDIECKIIGGANMFGDVGSNIGKQNILSAKEKLKREDIKLIGECVGGSQGRSVEFCVASGIVTVKIKL